jgi:hypothetical protein
MKWSMTWTDPEDPEYVVTGGDVQKSTYPVSVTTPLSGTVAASWYVAFAHLALSGTWTCPKQAGQAVVAPARHSTPKSGGMNFPAASALCPAQRTVRSVPRPPIARHRVSYRWPV